MSILKDDSPVFKAHTLRPPLRPAAPAFNRPGRLAVVSCYFNPCGYESLRANYQRWVNDMRGFGVPLFVAEAAFQGQPFVDPSAFLQLHAGPEHILWQKERLLNLVVERLPREFDAVAWIDADMLFLDRDWYRRTVEALAEYPVVQLFDKWHFTDAGGQIERTGCSVGHLAQRYLQKSGLPGGAWAARREVFPLYDQHILGSGDAFALLGWIGQTGDWLAQQNPPALHADWLRWSTEALGKVRGRIATLTGDAVHLNHGTRENRRYVERLEILRRYQFDPAKHVRIDPQGLLSWTADTPHGLVNDVRDYFLGRDEDGRPQD